MNLEVKKVVGGFNLVDDNGFAVANIGGEPQLAKLFAAAPDLLAALIEATSIFDNYPETLELIGTYQVIQNAISKATGERWN